ncbi:hypothetical protein [Devosia sp. DBB001]|nr:hypothetical protein [Devosia sp. DBB001]
MALHRFAQGAGAHLCIWALAEPTSEWVLGAGYGATAAIIEAPIHLEREPRDWIPDAVYTCIDDGKVTSRPLRDISTRFCLRRDLAHQPTTWAAE